VRPGGLGKFKKIHPIGTRSRDLPACSIVPQPLRYRVPPLFLFFFLILVCEAIGTSGHSWLIVPASGDSEDDCGEADGM
jgi:hypothetical protein